MLDYLKNDENKAEVVIPIVSKYHKNKKKRKGPPTALRIIRRDGQVSTLPLFVSIQ